VSDDQKTEPKTYDQAYVTRLENEAAKHRLATEAVAKERDDLAAFKAERERKDLEAKSEYEKALAKIESERKAEAKKYADELSARDRRTMVAEAKALATKAGIIDPSDVASLDLSDLRIAEDGTIAGLDKKIDELKAAKPHWFADPAQSGQTKAEKARAGASPAGNKGADLSVDWATKSKAEVDQYLNSILRG